MSDEPNAGHCHPNRARKLGWSVCSQLLPHHAKLVGPGFPCRFILLSKLRYDTAACFADTTCNWPLTTNARPSTDAGWKQTFAFTAYIEQRNNVRMRTLRVAEPNRQEKCLKPQRVQSACLFSADIVLEVLFEISHYGPSNWHMPCTTQSQTKRNDYR